MEKDRTNEPILNNNNHIISFGTSENAEKSKIEDKKYSNSLNKFYR
jgi:hypothetical protein